MGGCNGTGRETDETPPMSISLRWGTKDDLDLCVKTPLVPCNKCELGHLKRQSLEAKLTWDADSYNDEALDTFFKADKDLKALIADPLFEAGGCCSKGLKGGQKIDWCSRFVQDSALIDDKPIDESYQTQCGAYLDVDKNARDTRNIPPTITPVENIVWKKKVPPSGRYTITVNNYELDHDTKHESEGGSDIDFVLIINDEPTTYKIPAKAWASVTYSLDVRSNDKRVERIDLKLEQGANTKVFSRLKSPRRLLNQPKTHVRVLEALLEEINASIQ